MPDNVPKRRPKRGEPLTESTMRSVRKSLVNTASVGRGLNATNRNGRVTIAQKFQSPNYLAGFWGKITSSNGGGSYNYTKLESDGDGNLLETSFTGLGFEVNGTNGISTGTIVRMFRVNDTVAFEYAGDGGGGGANTVEYVSRLVKINWTGTGSASVSADILSSAKGVTPVSIAVNVWDDEATFPGWDVASGGDASRREVLYSNSDWDEVAGFWEDKILIQQPNTSNTGGNNDNTLTVEYVHSSEKVVLYVSDAGFTAPRTAWVYVAMSYIAAHPGTADIEVTET